MTHTHTHTNAGAYSAIKSITVLDMCLYTLRSDLFRFDGVLRYVSFNYRHSLKCFFYD